MPNIDDASQTVEAIGLDARALETK